MVQTDDTVEEPMDEGSDDEFPDVTIIWNQTLKM